MTVSRIAAILVTALFLQGCGLKFWYNRIDWIVPWYLDDFVELTGQQEAQLETFLVNTQVWHRQSELPEYVILLQNIRADLVNGTLPDHYEGHRKTIRKHYDRLLNRAVPELVELMLQLSSEQVQELFEALQQQDQESAESLVERSEDERVEEFIENRIDGLGDWLGRLDAQQKALIAQWATEHQSTLRERFEYRARWRQNLLEAFSEASNASAKQRLSDLLINGERLQSEALRQRYEHNAAVSKRYLLALYQTLSKSQLKRLTDRLDDYIDDFNDLASQDDS